MDGVWDDGGWTDREETGRRRVELWEAYPHADPVVVETFLSVVDAAERYRRSAGRHLALFGELGELFAEIKFGIKRHRRIGTPGSDGRLGNDFVEIKTISPDKRTNRVQVKRSGNFNQLVVVKISDDFEFEAKMIPRKLLSKGKGRYASVSWSSLPPGGDGE